MAVLHWSSPVRKSGTRTLSQIPNEIYLEIFQHVRSTNPTSWTHPSVKRDLSSLALVCRFFGSVTLPWIFEALEFDGDTKRNSSAYQNYASFCRSILKRESTARTMAQHVKKCAFASWGLKEDMSHNWCIQEFLSLYSRSMREMTNIQELSLVSTPITKDAIKAMPTLQRLETLVLRDCVLADDVTDKHLQKLSSLRLKSLTVTSKTRDEEDPVDRLWDHIDFSALMNLSTTSLPSLQKLVERQGNLLLEKLDVIEIDDAVLLSQIFSKTPALRSLRTRFQTPFASSSFKLDSKALPRLQRVEAPLSLLQIIVPKRPVSSIVFWPSPNDSPFYLKIPLWKYFPDLRTLEVRIDIKVGPKGIPVELLTQKAISELLWAWPKQPQLQTLILGHDVNIYLRYSLDLVMLHKWISEIIWPKIPTLRKCQFGKFVEWSFCEAASKWKPTILPHTYTIILDSLKSGRIGYSDYDGYIEGLLSQTD
ncbi:hypothetical protein GALMADRAFT_1233719 [Galerina marginata CBS 339.88]|uniref:F-box domain-containing protein n=1 Tax=Galerina marginata (strain CBS 339.88) TaxID=685588 RepID=A0A067T859_GALM3|nr:hypothetical protein GALMADRAFT_1233719 [Galerina marginata CBS 339.88]